MPKVLAQNYSNFYDIRTNVQFQPVKDRRSECFVGVAVVDKATIEFYQEREGFRVLSDEEYLEMTSEPQEPELTEPETGDPLKDAANKGEPAPAGSPLGSAPPPPPPPPGA